PGARDPAAVPAAREPLEPGTGVVGGARGPMMRQQIGVIGAGSWGTALAKLLAEKGFPVSLWVHDREHCRRIAERRENATYLPGITLPHNLTVSSDVGEVVRDKTAIVCAVPSH